MGKNSALILPLFLLLLTPCAFAAEWPHNWHIEHSGELSWEYVSGGELGLIRLRVPLEKTIIPAPILDNLVQAIDFAFREDAARKIHPDDLDHAHLLCKKGESCRRFNNITGMLLHTQEHMNYGESYKKRNVYLGPRGPSILPCVLQYGGWNYQRNKYNPLRKVCVVHPSDLGVESIDVWFVKVDYIPSEYLEKYEHNVRIVKGEKILFGIAMSARIINE